MKSIILLALLLASPGGLCCTSFLVDCGDGATVHARTWDFDGELRQGLTFYPAAIPFTGTPLTKGKLPPIFHFRHNFIKLAYSDLGPDTQPWLTDGLNTAGLSVALLWQSAPNATFHRRYNPAGPAAALALPDLPYYALGSFSSVEEVRAFLAQGQVQLTTDIQHPGLWAALAHIFGEDPDVPPPDPDGTLHLALHLHFTDASGARLLLEASAAEPCGYALHETGVVTNEPSWPEMAAWREAFLAHDFAGVPGLGGQVAPPLAPKLIPFNSNEDAAQVGYFGSLSRFLRAWLSLQHCADHPWPPFAWSPGHPAASASPPPGSYRALKRAENLLGAVVVPMSQLASPVDLAGGYATQIMVLKDLTRRVYYFRTAQHNHWSSVDLLALQGTAAVRRFQLGVERSPFSVDVTFAGEGAPAAQGIEWTAEW